MHAIRLSFTVARGLIVSIVPVPDVPINSNVYQAVMNESNPLLASTRASNTSEKHCEFPAFLVAAVIAGAVLLIIVVTVGLGGGFQLQ